MDGQDNAQSRAVVQNLLWDVIDASGLHRPKGMTVDDYTKMRQRIIKRLAYMSEGNLMVLADLIVTQAIGKGPRCHCWPEAAILTNGFRLQSPPPREKPIVYSWLTSVEGPPAIAGGYAVELFRWLRKFGRPPPSGMVQIKKRAAANTRDKELFQERLDRGVQLQPADRDWLAAYERDAAFVADLVAAGVEKRAKQGADHEQV